MRQTLLCILVLGALAKAMPYPQTVTLTQALDHTVCPIEVKVDYNPDRIPSRIKMLRCSPKPEEWCTKQHIPQNECCNHTHDRRKMNCVEMQDMVLVQYKDGTNGTLSVAVGCSCMVTNVGIATEVPPGPQSR